MEHRPYIIGVLGGMGTYATIHLFEQYANWFPAEKEWDRPRIIIDNRCTMPSRVRAALYGENRDRLLEEMTESIGNFINSGCNRIILACNTAHLFLDGIYEALPEARERIISIIDTTVEELGMGEVEEVFLLASEGTIESGIYQMSCESRGIKCIVPSREEYSLLRDSIEAVKRNEYTEAVKESFVELINRYKICILGCTELPILYERYNDLCYNTKVYDPIDLTLQRMRKEFIKGI